MDREKAIQVLKRCEAESHCEHYKRHYCCIGCGQREALDLAIEALSEPQIEKHQLSGETSTISEETSTNEGDAESATTTDCISRQEVLDLVSYWLSGGEGGDILERIGNLPPVNQNQITGKLETAEIATSEGEESTMNQPKSKLDLISRAKAISAVRSATVWRRSLGRGDILDILYSIPPVTPTERLPHGCHYQSHIRAVIRNE